jgi:hypothetical protein
MDMKALKAEQNPVLEHVRRDLSQIRSDLLRIMGSMLWVSQKLKLAAATAPTLRETADGRRINLEECGADLLTELAGSAFTDLLEACNINNWCKTAEKVSG